MSYQVLARKWRPKGFAELVGQEHVVRALSNALDNDRVHHAYLFTGTRGVGKTTLARILAKSLNCQTGVTSNPCGKCASCREIDEGRFVDLIEVDAASRTKVDQTRELLENVPYAPVAGRYKVYLIDEVHMFSDSSFNALLKTLEEPPPHVKFLLATTDPQKVPVTVLSRCLQFNLKRLPVDQIQGQLKTILESEKIFFDASALQQLAIAADGSMRDALSLLDQSIVFGGGQVREDDVASMLGTVSHDYVYRLLQALLDADATAMLKLIDEMAQQSIDFISLLTSLLTFLHKIALLQQADVDWLEDTIDPEKMNAFVAQFKPEDVQLFYQMSLVGQNDLFLAPDPRMGFEMLMLRLLAFKPDDAESSEETEKTAAKISPRPRAKSSPEVKKVSSSETETQVKQAPPAVKATPVINDPASKSWSEILGQLGLGGLTGQFAGHCAVKSWTENQLQLALDPQHASLKDSRAEKMLCKSLEEAFPGLKVKIEIEASSNATPQQQKELKQQEKQSSAEQAIMQDPYVQAFQNKFDAEVVKESIKPVDS
jgi:DNA polymerase III subunit gamma/tau